MNTPNIRFKGFTGDWEQRKLGDISEIRTGPFGSVLHAEDYVSDGMPIITTEHFKIGSLPIEKEGLPQVSDSDYQRLNNYKLECGDIVFSRVGSVDINALVEKEQSDWLFSGRVLRVRPQDTVNGRYLHYLLETKGVKDDIVSRAVGQTMPSINTEILNATTLCLSNSNKEQKLIGECLANFDKLITLHQRKCNSLKQVKKYMLQKMFPKQGEKVPEIRFAGFTGDWKQQKVGDIAETTYGGGTPRTSVEEYWNGDIPWIQSSNLTENELFSVDIQKRITETGLHKSAAQLVPKNSIAVVSHVGVGKLVFMPVEYTTSQDFISLSDLQTEPKFTCYALHRRLQQDLHIVQGSAIKGITKEDLLGKEINAPSIEEQEEIGAYFYNLDNLLTLHQRKSDSLKEIKKFMLQNMFPRK